jgi:gag-polypeptide of LTR copia-type/Zinc knuckle
MDDVKASNGKIAFNLIKGYKSKHYPDRNAAIAWERLKNKNEPISAPSMIKSEEQFQGLSLKTDHHSELWITELEDLCVRLEDMDSSVSDNQFMIHVLSNLTSEYDSQLALMEKRMGDVEKPLIVAKIKVELSLHFQRLNMNTNGNDVGEILEEHALFSAQFAGKCQNCGQIGHKAFQCKKKQMNNGGNNGNMTGSNYCFYCHKTGHEKNIILH